MTIGKGTQPEFIAFPGEIVAIQSRKKEIHLIGDTFSAQKTTKV
jgi:hypothetical protein